MKITNKSNLPQIVEDWAKSDQYERGTADYTTTELIKPVRVLGLERKHGGNSLEARPEPGNPEIEVDIQDLFYRMDGQANHTVFERLAAEYPERYVAETRYTMAVAGATISGQLDLYDRETKTLHDMKWTKVWKWVGIKKKVPGVDVNDWTQQANINAFLCYHIGNHVVEKLSNIVRFRDWDMRQAQRDPQFYPQDKCVEWPLEKWDFAKTLQFIQSRIGSHTKAAGEGTLPLCSPTERWQKPPRWAVMKQGRKRAVKLFDTNTEAAKWANEQSDVASLSIEERKGEDTRCLFYCDVAAYCDHGREVLAEAQKL